MDKLDTARLLAGEEEEDDDVLDFRKAEIIDLGILIEQEEKNLEELIRDEQGVRRACLYAMNSPEMKVVLTKIFESHSRLIVANMHAINVLREFLRNRVVCELKVPSLPKNAEYIR